MHPVQLHLSQTELIVLYRVELSTPHSSVEHPQSPKCSNSYSRSKMKLQGQDRTHRIFETKQVYYEESTIILKISQKGSFTTFPPKTLHKGNRNYPIPRYPSFVQRLDFFAMQFTNVHVLLSCLDAPNL